MTSAVLTDQDAQIKIANRQRPENDVYPTPLWAAEQTLRRLAEFDINDILDVGAGSGVWGRAAVSVWPDASRLHGVEIRYLPIPDTYTLWFAGRDFLTSDLPYKYDLVMGNPPYKDAEAFVRRSLHFTKDDGWVAFLLPITFLNSQGRAKLFKEFPPRYVVPFSKRPSFSGNGKTKNGEYMSIYWQKGHTGKTWIEWI